MLLYLLRHGDALDNPSLHDSERPLSKLGLEQSRTAANFFKASRISFDLIVSSPLLRALQMASTIKEQLKVAQLITSEYLVPGSNHRELIELLNEQKAESILLVGHEPHLSTTIALLVFGETTPRVEMKKASCACLEVPRPIEKGRGALKWLLTAEQMKLAQ